MIKTIFFKHYLRINGVVLFFSFYFHNKQKSKNALIFIKKYFSLASSVAMTTAMTSSATKQGRASEGFVSEKVFAFSSLSEMRLSFFFSLSSVSHWSVYLHPLGHSYMSSICSISILYPTPYVLSKAHLAKLPPFRSPTTFVPQNGDMCASDTK